MLILPSSSEFLSQVFLSDRLFEIVVIIDYKSKLDIWQDVLLKGTITDLEGIST